MVLYFRKIDTAIANLIGESRGSRDDNHARLARPIAMGPIREDPWPYKNLICIIILYFFIHNIKWKHHMNVFRHFK